MRRNTFILASLCTVLIISCKKDKEVAPDVGYNYFPVNVGHYVIYEGDSIAYKDDLQAPHDTFRFLVKEKIESIYTDNEGRPTLSIHRYIKNYDPAVPYSAMQWQHSDMWAANRTASTAERVEENIRFVKLVFPVEKNRSWNGNIYNTLEPWDYSFGSVDQPENINSNSFDSVATVIQNNEENLVDRKYGVEKYAKNAGLVYKELLILKKQPHGPSDFPPYDDSTGVWYHLRVLTWGTE
jgi:hypothetical protein